MINLSNKIIIFDTILSNRLFLVPALLTLFFAVMYTFIPNRKKHFIQEIPGAFIASAGWLLFSELYSLYIIYIANYS